MMSLAADIESRSLSPSLDDVRLVTIARARDEFEAQLIANLLGDADIEAMVTGAVLAGFRAEAPADVCVVVREADAEAARAALAAPRPALDDAGADGVGADDQAPEDETPEEVPSPRGGISARIVPAGFALGIASALAIFGLWLAGLPTFEVTPLEFVLTLCMLVGLLIGWRRRQN